MLYEKMEKNYKILMFIPIALMIISAGYLLNNLATKGSFIERDVELVGGKVITIPVDSADISAIKRAFPDANVKITQGVSKTLIVEIPPSSDENEVIETLRGIVTFKGEPSIRSIGPALGEIFFNQAQLSIIVAFIIMIVVVFLLFRSVVPSSIVVLAALTDIISSMAISSFLGVKLSLPVIVALLTLIGYSVDTDILLTSELLKKHDESISVRIKRAMKTGLTMSATILASLFAIYFVSGSFVLQQMAIVLIVGTAVDIFATWFTNAGLLRYWLLKKGAKQ